MNRTTPHSLSITEGVRRSFFRRTLFSSSLRYRSRKSCISCCGAVRIPNNHPPARQMISLTARIGPLKCGSRWAVNFAPLWDLNDNLTANWPTWIGQYWCLLGNFRWPTTRPEVPETARSEELDRSRHRLRPVVFRSSWGEMSRARHLRCPPLRAVAQVVWGWAR